MAASQEQLAKGRAPAEIADVVRLGRSHGESAWLADLRRAYHSSRGGRARKIALCLREPGTHAVTVFRFGHWLLGRSLPVRIVLDPVYLLLNFLVHVLWGIEISRHATIGPGLLIAHFGGITVSGLAVIGRDCNLSNNVTIGQSGQGVPVIGDEVYIAPGARLFGKIHIGNNVQIGANAVVHKDIPDRAVVVLEPGFRILSYKGNRLPPSGNELG